MTEIKIDASDFSSIEEAMLDAMPRILAELAKVLPK